MAQRANETPIQIRRELSLILEVYDPGVDPCHANTLSNREIPVKETMHVPRACSICGKYMRHMQIFSHGSRLNACFPVHVVVISYRQTIVLLT